MSWPDVVAVLRAFRAVGLDTRVAEDEQHAWDADCPVCRPLSDGVWPLRITEPYAGGPARLSCISRCDPQEILTAAGITREPSIPPALLEGREDRSRLRVLDVERLLGTPPPSVPWIAAPLLARGAVTMVAGREGHGKSLLALALAAAIGRGDGVAGIGCEQGRVLVVDAENGEAETHRRLSGLDVAASTLTYAEAGDFDLRKHLADVEELVRTHQPTAVVLDSLRSLTPGLDENDSGPVEAALGPLRRLSRQYACAVLVLHHAGKIGGSYRGSTAIGAAVDLGFTLASDRPDGSDDGHRTLTCWKSRIAARPGPVTFRIEAAGGRAQITAARARPAPEVAPSRNAELAQRLAKIVAARGTLNWGELCKEAGIDAESGTSKRARERAIESGQLVACGRGRYGPPERSTVQAIPIGETDGRTVADDGERGA